MLLAIDIGNTNVVLGIYQDQRLLCSWRIATDLHKTWMEYALIIRGLFDLQGLDPAVVDGVAVASVVPDMSKRMRELCQGFFKLTPMFVGPGVKTGIPIKMDNPREVGADRIINAVAGFEFYGGPLIIVDFGTAITFDYISANSEYMGGAIAPGMGISQEALFAKTAKLPRVDIVCPEQVIGRNTVQSIQSGILYGCAGMVDGIVERMWEEIGQKTYVVATGGMAELVARQTHCIDKVDRLLTLEGLRLIYYKNR